jgi:transcriptional regulator with XRE-family HTH domain
MPTAKPAKPTPPAAKRTTAAARKRPLAKAKPATKQPPKPASGLVGSMRTMAQTMLDVGAAGLATARTLRAASEAANALRQGKPITAAGRVMQAVLPAATQSRAWAKVGSTLKGLREAAGMTIDEVGAAIDLKDPAVIEAAENGRVALSFELILRLAAVLGRNDPVGFIMQLTRDSNPEVWRSLDKIGIGKLLVHSAREREFANIYRGDDDARTLSDAEFVEVLAFTQAAFAMAMQFRARRAA